MRHVQQYFIFDCWFSSFQEIAPQNHKFYAETIGPTIKNKTSSDLCLHVDYHIHFKNFSGYQMFIFELYM